LINIRHYHLPLRALLGLDENRVVNKRRGTIKIDSQTPEVVSTETLEAKRDRKARPPPEANDPLKDQNTVWFLPKRWPFLLMMTNRYVLTIADCERKRTDVPSVATPIHSKNSRGFLRKQDLVEGLSRRKTRLS
jgi:hypothetical protein